ncbi:hypothetical protein FRB98_006472 [Tulasnella sp. 332]|nr:hypothetical protein FRB98_006472 [Tulasnella sp. 332]
MSRLTRPLSSRTGSRTLATPPHYDDDFRSIRAWTVHASSTSAPPESILSRTPSSVPFTSSSASTSAPTSSSSQSHYLYRRSSSSVLREKDQPISLSRLLSFIWVVGVAAGLFWWGCHCQRPPKVHLERVARLSSIHVPFALDVVKRLLEVKEASTLALFDTGSLQLIANKAEADWRTESTELQAVIRQIHHLSQDLEVGAYRMIGTKFWDLQSTIAVVRLYLRRIASLRKKGRRDLTVEAKLKVEIHFNLGGPHLASMYDLLTVLNTALDRCAVVLDHKSSFHILVPQAQSTWRLDESQSSVWAAWRWLSGDIETRQDRIVNAERKQLAAALLRAKDQFELIERLNEAAVQARRSLKRYISQQHKGIFLSEQDAETVGRAEGRKAIEEYFVST